MALRLNGSSSGYVELEVPAAAGSHTLTLPDGGGTSGQYLQTDGSGGLSWQTVTDTDTTGWTWDTTGTSLSGSSVSITGIPSTATKIIVGVRDLSQSDDANWSVVAGTSSGLATSGYASQGYYLTVSNGNDFNANSSSWQTFGGASNAFEFNGTACLTKLTGNVWFCEGSFGLATSHNNVIKWQGHVELGGTLDRVGLTKSSGNFDAGTAFVHYFSP